MRGAGSDHVGRGTDFDDEGSDAVVRTASRTVTSSRQAPPREPGRWNHQSMRTHDLRTVQRASAIITELGRDLDRQLASERRPEERLRMLRETTNRITRTANDAVHAYRRASRAIDVELAKPDGDGDAAREMRTHLNDARANVLRVLELASARYPDPPESIA